jgi:hypothetical protein
MVWVVLVKINRSVMYINRLGRIRVIIAQLVRTVVAKFDFATGGQLINNPRIRFSRRRVRRMKKTPLRSATACSTTWPTIVDS